MQGQGSVAGMSWSFDMIISHTSAKKRKFQDHFIESRGHGLPSGPIQMYEEAVGIRLLHTRSR